MVGNYNSAAIQIYKNGARQYGGDIHFTPYSTGNNQWDNVSYSQVLQLAASDYVEVRNSTTTVTYHGMHWQLFSGYLLG